MLQNEIIDDVLYHQKVKYTNEQLYTVERKRFLLYSMSLINSNNVNFDLLDYIADTISRLYNVKIVEQPVAQFKQKDNTIRNYICQSNQFKDLDEMIEYLKNQKEVYVYTYSMSNNIFLLRSFIPE